MPISQQIKLVLLCLGIIFWLVELGGQGNSLRAETEIQKYSA